MESGATLTIEPGAVFKIGGLNVNGTLDAQGTATDPIVFTSTLDDAAGGDSNGDGAQTTPGPGNWSGISLNSGSGASVLDHTQVRYAGTNVWSGAIQVTNSTPLIKNSTIRDNVGAGVYVMGGGPELAANTIRDNSRHGIFGNFDRVDVHDNLIERSAWGMRIDANDNTNAVSLSANTVRDNTGAPGYTHAITYAGGATAPLPPDLDDNVLSGNDINAIYLSGKVTQSATWQAQNYAYVIESVLGGGELTIPNGSTLTLEPGTIVKGSRINVNGTLDAQGTAAEPIIFTSTKDDAAGGDSNGDGSNSTPAPGNWTGISFASNNLVSGRGTLRHVVNSYAIQGISIICPCPTPPTVRHSTIARTSTNGIAIGNDPGPTPDGGPVISWNIFRHIGGNAISKASGAELHAPHNDYGCDSGPKPIGCGDSVTELINAYPWAYSMADEDSVCEGGEAVCGVDADPVIMATGAFTYSHADPRLPGRDGPLTFARTYNSSDSSDAGLGQGWSHIGLMSAFELQNGDVVIRRPSGRRDTYELLPDGSYEQPKTSSWSKLVKTGSTFELSEGRGGATLREYRFDSSGRIERRTDRHGLVRTWGYTTEGRLSTITDAGGQQLTFTYNGNGRIIKVQDSAGRAVTFSYEDDKLRTATDPLNGVTTYAYGSQGRITSITDPRGNAFVRNTYDNDGRVIEQRDGENSLWTLNYEPNETRLHPPGGGVKVIRFDGEKRMISRSDAAGNVTSFNYDADGNLSEIVRPGGPSWRFDYGSFKNLTAVHAPGGVSESYTYDPTTRLPSV